MSTSRTCETLTRPAITASIAGMIWTASVAVIVFDTPIRTVALSALDGLLLHMRGRRLSVRPFATATGYGPPRARELGEEELRALAGGMAALAPGRLPANLYDPAYLDLTVEVLGHRLSVQARRFAGLAATTHGTLQRDFEKLLEQLRALAAGGV